MKLIDNIKIRKRLKMQGKTNFIDSVNHALDGISYTVEKEKNFKKEIIMAIIVMIAGFYFKVSKIEWLGY